MALQFTKATKRRRKARVALMGPTGSGKTWTALEIARGLVGDTGRIAVIDTERGSASLYESLTEFDVLELTSFAPERYVEAIKAATAGAYDALVIDSWSHAWSGKDGILEYVDQKKKQARGNDFTVWGDATPKQNEMVEAILAAPMHVVVTMRSKMAYILEEQERGGRKVQVPRKVGMRPIQRDGVEYEFDVVADMDLDHNLMIAKTRCSILADVVVRKPTRDLGGTLRAWLEDGAAPVTRVTVNGKDYQTAGIKRDALLAVWRLSAALEKASGKGAAKAVMEEKAGVDSSLQLTAESGAAVIVALREACGAAGVDPDAEVAA